MRYFVNITIIGVLLLLGVGCTISDEGGRSTNMLATTIWNTSEGHIYSVASAIEDVVRIVELVAIEDEAERDKYLSTFFGGGTLTEQGYGYSITTLTSYQTQLSWLVHTNGHAFGDGEWCVERTGGNGYIVRISRSEDEYVAEFESLYAYSQAGTATIWFSYELDYDNLSSAGYPDIVGRYFGNIDFTDGQKSETKPLMVNTSITEHLTISDYCHLLSGRVVVECVDKFFGTTDKINVLIRNNPARVDIKYYDDLHTIYSVGSH